MPGIKKSHFLSFVVNMMQLSSDLRFLTVFGGSFICDGFSRYLLHSAMSDRS